MLVSAPHMPVASGDVYIAFFITRAHTATTSGAPPRDPGDPIDAPYQVRHTRLYPFPNHSAASSPLPLYSHNTFYAYTTPFNSIQVELLHKCIKITTDVKCFPTGVKASVHHHPSHCRPINALQKPSRRP